MVCASGCCPSTSSDQVDWRMIHSISSGLIATSQQIISKTSITRSAAECKLLTWCRCPFGRWLFFAIEKIFKTDCSKRDFLSDQIGGLFKTANDAFSSEHFVNFCEKGSKKCVLAAYHMRDFFGGVRTGTQARKYKWSVNFLEKASKNRVPVAYAVRGFFSVRHRSKRKNLSDQIEGVFNERKISASLS